MSRVKGVGRMEVLAGGGRRSHLASTHPVRGQSNIYPLLGRVMHMTFFQNSSATFFQDVRIGEIFHNDLRRNYEKSSVGGELGIFHAK